MLDALRKHLLFVGAVVVAAVFAAGDLSGTWKWITGRELGPGWTLLAAIALLGVLALYEMHKLDRSIEDLKARIRVAAKIGALSGNIPDPGPSKTSLRVDVTWEIWTDVDVSTDQLGLNVIYLYDRRWWQIRGKRIRKIGLPPQGGSTLYRRQIKATDSPFKDNATFEYLTDRHIEGNPHWILELVLKTGMPRTEHRIPVYLDMEELRRRGSSPPL